MRAGGGQVGVEPFDRVEQRGRLADRLLGGAGREDGRRGLAGALVAGTPAGAVVGTGAGMGAGAGGAPGGAGGIEAAPPPLTDSAIADISIGAVLLAALDAAADASAASRVASSSELRANASRSRACSTLSTTVRTAFGAYCWRSRASALLRRGDPRLLR